MNKKKDNALSIKGEDRMKNQSIEIVCRIVGFIFFLLVLSYLASFTKSAYASNKYIGVHITDSQYVEEAVQIGNTVSFYPNDLQDITEHLRQINNRAHAVFSVQSLFWENGKGFVYRDIQFLVEAIESSGHTMDVVAAFDEPLWTIRRACLAGSAIACADVESGYPETIRNIGMIVEELKGAGIKASHTESYVELYYQAIELGRAVFSYNADIVGFVCYGPIGKCGGQFGAPKLPQVRYINFVLEQIELNSSQAKLALIPGIATGFGGLNTWKDASDQFYYYYNTFLSMGSVAAFIGFNWNSFSSITGGRDGPYRENIEQLFNSLL